MLRGLSQHGKPILTRAYGSAELEHGSIFTPATLSRPGSVAKQFTAAAILLLVQKGKLSLSDEVRKHAPELPDYGHKITIDHLITHTSGIRDWGHIVSAAGAPRGSKVYSTAEALKKGRGLELRQSNSPRNQYLKGVTPCGEPPEETMRAQ